MTLPLAQTYRRFSLHRIGLPGLLLLVAAPSLAVMPEGDPSPLRVELVEITRFFWVDLPGQGGARSGSIALDGSFVSVEILAEESPGGWLGASGQALVIVGAGTEALERFAVVSLRRDAAEDRAIDLEQVVGVRFPTRHGRFNVLFASRLEGLPDFARLEVESMIRLLQFERRLYREAYYRVAGVEHTEIRWIHALGPDLVKLPRKWLKILEGDRSALTKPSLLESDDACFKLGPFHLCLDAQALIESARSVRHPRAMTRVVVRKRWPEQGAGCGLVLWSRPFTEGSAVAFEVATQRRGLLGGGTWSRSHEGPNRRTEDDVRRLKQEPRKLASPRPPRRGPTKKD